VGALKAGVESLNGYPASGRKPKCHLLQSFVVVFVDRAAHDLPGLLCSSGRFLWVLDEHPDGTLKPAHAPGEVDGEFHLAAEEDDVDEHGNDGDK
jgi:hypothetical protein